VAKCRGGFQEVIGTPEEHGIPEAARAVAKEVGDRIIGKDRRRDFLKRAERRERAQRPDQGERVESGTLRQIRCGKRTFVEMVGHAASNERVEHGR
jgi:hypothetical protein